MTYHSLCIFFQAELAPPFAYINSARPPVTKEHMVPNVLNGTIEVISRAMSFEVLRIKLPHVVDLLTLYLL